jgi:hypothetical protein
MKSILTILLMTLSLSLSVIGSNYQEKQSNKSAPLKTSYCELVRNPDKYNGQEVTLHATYSYGLEGQDLLCLECRDAGHTWLEIDKDKFPKIKSALKKMPKDAGIVNADFTGMFVSSRGPYGDGRYRFKFVATAINNIEVVYKGLPPPNLYLRRKMCGNVIDGAI